MKEQKIIIKWIVSDYRKDSRHGVLSPVKLSKYGEYLMKIGAGWSE